MASVKFVRLDGDTIFWMALAQSFCHWGDDGLPMFFFT